EVTNEEVLMAFTCTDGCFLTIPKGSTKRECTREEITLVNSGGINHRSPPQSGLTAISDRNPNVPLVTVLQELDGLPVIRIQHNTGDWIFRNTSLGHRTADHINLGIIHRITIRRSIRLDIIIRQDTLEVGRS